MLFLSLFFGICIHVVFSREEEFFAGDGPFLAWNYTDLSKALYTGFLLNLNGGGYDEMMRFFKQDIVKFLVWFIIVLAFKFLLPGFLIGALTGNYQASYQQYVDFILKFPKLTKIIKTEIHQGKYTNERGK